MRDTTNMYEERSKWYCNVLFIIIIDEIITRIYLHVKITMRSSPLHSEDLRYRLYRYTCEYMTCFRMGENLALQRISIPQRQLFS